MYQLFGAALIYLIAPPAAFGSRFASAARHPGSLHMAAIGPKPTSGGPVARRDLIYASENSIHGGGILPRDANDRTDQALRSSLVVLNRIVRNVGTIQLDSKAMRDRIIA